MFISIPIISDVRGIGSSICTKFFERDIGAVRTSCKRAIDVVSSERTYKQRNAVFYNMARAYHGHNTSVERS